MHATFRRFRATRGLFLPLALALLARPAAAPAQTTPDCAALDRPPDSASGESCLMLSEPVVAIVYSEEDAQRLAGGRRIQLIERLVGHLERWSGETLDAAQRERLRGVLGRRLQIESTLSMTPDDSGRVFMLQGVLVYQVRDSGRLLALFEEATGGRLARPGGPAPSPSAPPRPAAPPASAVPAETWRVSLRLEDATGHGTVRGQVLDFGSSRSVLAAEEAPVFEVGPELDTRLAVRPGTGALQAVLRLDGYYPAPPDGAFVVPRESLQVRWQRPPDGETAREVVRLVPQRPVIASLLNMAGLDEDQLDASADLVGLVAAGLARAGYTHFMQMNGHGRRTEVRSQAYFPADPDELARAARELIDDRIAEAGPLLPQLGGGLVQCRATGIAPCWMIYIARRNFANRPSGELLARLHELPQPGERVLVVELLEKRGVRPLYAEVGTDHLATTLPDDWPDGGRDALAPLAERIVALLTRDR